MQRLRLFPVLGAVIGTALVAAALAGCAGGSASGNSTSPATQTVTVGTITSPTTVTAVVSSAQTAVPPPVTDEPAAISADCPYLSDTDVADINGQHTGQTQIIDVMPYPICVFSRADGGWMATVRIIQADTTEAATAAVDAHVPIESSDPASQPPGWAGGAMVTADKSVYAVSKGPIAVVAESNQLQSIKGRQMVIKTVANLLL
jgi:hypothetical protein